MKMQNGNWGPSKITAVGWRGFHLFPENSTHSEKPINSLLFHVSIAFLAVTSSSISDLVKGGLVKGVQGDKDG